VKFQKTLSVLSFVTLATCAAACGSAAGTTSNGGTGGDDAGPASTGGSTGGSETGGAPTTTALAFKTHVILGDTISDGGGQGPFFYDLLDTNDDTAYPAFAGKDLTTKYGSDLNIVKASKAGSTAAALLGQAQGLPTSLPGPVLITITIGGNDVQGAMGAIVISGNDTTQLSTFSKNLDATLQELTKPNRFGQGVDVRILLANVYDPSDGTGVFAFANGSKCPGALALWPANKPTDPSLLPWEAAMATTAQPYSQVVVLGLHDEFHGHGVSATPTWFFTDCLLPNATGHEQIRELFWGAVTAL
jgi:lysophospholipase L1-like esterase